MPCTHCGAAKHWARGFCQPCYYRLRRNGTVQRKYVVNSGKCSVEGCENHSFAKNLCQAHYNRAADPLKTAWKQIRSRNPDQFPETWERFDKFLADVGSRPSPKHQLRRIDGDKPFSADNVRWQGPVSTNGHKWSKEEAAAYDKAWTLKKKYGLSVEQYDRMVAVQNGCCAICGGKESHVHKSGKLKDLSVDHCHTTNAVRGLLCSNCNRGIGYLNDSIERVDRAAAYLRKYAT